MSEVVVIARAVIYKDINGQYRWRTIGGNNEILGYGEAYSNKGDCVAVLMAHLNDEIDIEEEW